MFRPFPISFLQFGLFWVVVAIGATALFRAFARSREQGTSVKKSGLASTGIAIQGIAFGVIGFGPMHIALPWSAPSSLICSALVALFGGSAVAIFLTPRWRSDLDTEQVRRHTSPAREGQSDCDGLAK